MTGGQQDLLLAFRRTHAIVDIGVYDSRHATDGEVSSHPLGQVSMEGVGFGGTPNAQDFRGWLTQLNTQVV